MDPGNLHALCNLAIFRHAQWRPGGSAGDLSGRCARWCRCSRSMSFKLATTMGILGEHEAAYRHFRRLLRELSGRRDPCLLITRPSRPATSAAWMKPRGTVEGGGAAGSGSGVPEYLSAASGATGSPAGAVRRPSYHYHLPFEEQLRRWKARADELPERMKRDPLVRSSFFWALRHGDRG